MILVDAVFYSVQHSRIYEEFFGDKDIGAVGRPAEIEQAHDRRGSDYPSSDSWRHTQTRPEHAGVHRRRANLLGMSSTNCCIPLSLDGKASIGIDGLRASLGTLWATIN